MVTLGAGIEEDHCKHYHVSTLIRLGSNDNGLPLHLRRLLRQEHP